MADKMREIKFRAWDKDKQIMLYDGDLMISLTGIVEGYSDDDGGKSGLWEHAYKVNVELMQFTGLKDKNGVEIYEGDILKGIRTTLMGEVKFLCGEFTYSHKYADDSLFSRIDETEIIGNIYQNPELLLEAK